MIDALKSIFNFSKNINASINDTPSSKISIDKPTFSSTKISNSKDVTDSMNEVKKSLNLVGRQAYEQVKSTI
ncbi:hypothetical protein LA56_1855 [Francisella philomiragia]|nr:hypothetical protein LA56_1855 [Francisella philomiragia]